MNEQERKELEDALNKFLAQDSSSKEEPEEPTGYTSLHDLAHNDISGTWEWDKKDILEDELRPHLNAIRRICQREDMSFLFCTVTKYEQGAYKLHPEVGLYGKVCEFIACLGIINLPHDISHQIITFASSIGMMMRFNPFAPIEESDKKE